MATLWSIAMLLIIVMAMQGEVQHHDQEKLWLAQNLSLTKQMCHRESCTIVYYIQGSQRVLHGYTESEYSETCPYYDAQCTTENE